MTDNKKRSFSSVVWREHSDEIEKAVSAYIGRAEEVANQDKHWQNR